MARRLPVLALVFALAGCAGNGEDGSAWERIRAEGKVRIGIANEPPYGYLEADGSVAGEAPAVARRIFAGLGVGKVEPVVVEFGSLIPGLNAGRFDVIAAGMYVTPERCREVLFSDPSYRIAEAVLVAAGNPLGIHSYEDVRDHESAVLGVVAGAVEAGYAREVGIPESRLVILPDNATAMAAVRSGRVVAYAGTALTIARLAESSPDVEAAEPFRGPVIDGEEIAGYGAFAFRRSDVELRDRFNTGLLDLLGTQVWRDLVAPYGFGDHTLPDRTARELCRDTAGPP